jgi:hypothetical protein
MAVKYTSIFPSNGLHNIAKLGFFGLKINHLATLFETSGVPENCTAANLRCQSSFSDLSNAFANSTSDAMKARSFPAAKIFFVAF